MATLEQVLAVRDQLAAKTLGPALSSRRLLVTKPTDVYTALAHATTTVHAIGVGLKVVSGRVTEELCVRFHVIQKLPENLLPPFSVLPRVANGVKTDVIESPPAFFLAGTYPRIAQAGRKSPRSAKRAKSSSKRRRRLVPFETAPLTGCDIDPRSHVRPVRGGISAAHENVMLGTFGCICYPNEAPHQPCALSNNHVFANVNAGMQNDPIYQPSCGDYGTSSDTVAKLLRFVALDFDMTVGNKVDCAIAALSEGVQYVADVACIGSVSGISEATHLTPVRKQGRTTGLTSGSITDVAYEAVVGVDPNDPSRLARMTDQLRIVSSSTSAFAQGGDSGSVIFEASTTSVVGMLCAGPTDYSYVVANKIQNVMSALQIGIVATTVRGIV
jgi:hypothetical protein